MAQSLLHICIIFQQVPAKSFGNDEILKNIIKNIEDTGEGNQMALIKTIRKRRNGRKVKERNQKSGIQKTICYNIHQW